MPKIIYKYSLDQIVWAITETDDKWTVCKGLPIEVIYIRIQNDEINICYDMIDSDGYTIGEDEDRLFISKDAAQLECDTLNGLNDSFDYDPNPRIYSTDDNMDWLEPD